MCRHRSAEHPSIGSGGKLGLQKTKVLAVVHSTSLPAETSWQLDFSDIIPRIATINTINPSLPPQSIRNAFPCPSFDTAASSRNMVSDVAQTRKSAETSPNPCNIVVHGMVHS